MRLSVALTLLMAAPVIGCQQKIDPISPAAMEAAASRQSPAIGKAAPAFTLPNQDDESVALSSLRGKWVVLYFYPRDDTPGCTCQATEFTEFSLQFRKMNAEVYGISADTPASHRQFIQAHKLDAKQHVRFLTSRKAYRAFVDYWNSKLGDAEPADG